MNKLVVVICACFLNIISSQQNSATKYYTPTLEEIVWLEEFIHPIKTFDPNYCIDNDLEFLKAFVQDSKILALGENSHGSSEIFKMKHRIIKFLSKNKNYDIFSIEGNMPEAYKLNNYIRNDQGNATELIRGMYFWTWRTQEVLDMVQWMKKYSDSGSKITFTGFDMQYYQGAIEELMAYFTNNREAVKHIIALKEVLDRTVVKAKKTGNRTIVYKDNKKIKKSMDAIRQAINTTKSKNDEWLLQNLKIIEQYVNLKESRNNYLRDKYMAENIKWIKSQNPKSRIILWAHNAHIKKAGRIKRMGEYLSDTLKSDYVNIGFSFHEGNYTGFSKEGPRSYSAQKSLPSSYEHFFNSLKAPIFFLDLRNIKKQKPKLGKWLLNKYLFRQVGALKHDNEFIETNLSSDFDGIIFIKKSSSSTVLD